MITCGITMTSIKTSSFPSSMLLHSLDFNKVSSSFDNSATSNSLPTTSYFREPIDSFSSVNNAYFTLPKKKNLKLQTSFTCRNNSSPFTEKSSFQRQWGGPLQSKHSTNKSLLNENSLSSSQPGIFSDKVLTESKSSDSKSVDLNYEVNDIASRLPELREVLELLKKKKKEESQSQEEPVGSVYLVGTGPGDPDLLTLKAAKVMQTADLVLYDRLVSSSILDLTNPETRLLYVGKTSGYHSRTQDEIHTLLLSFAQEGAKVVRLKGGDPLIFGRGGEEIEFLQNKGIQVQIIPGVTSASGICSELNIPLTHRGISNSIRFLTGHSRKGGADPLHVAESAADVDSTLVIYMGLSTLPGLAEKLIQNGLPENTPAVAVERGTTPEQRFVFASLLDLPGEVERRKFISPTLIIVGRVVALSHLWPFKNETEDQGWNRISEPKDLFRNEPCLIMAQEPRDRNLRGPDPLLPSQI